MQNMIKILMYGQIITSWLMLLTGLIMCCFTLLIKNKEKRGWLGYSGLFVISLSIFIMIHYFTRNTNNVVSIIRALYETFPEVAMKILQ